MFRYCKPAACAGAPGHARQPAQVIAAMRQPSRFCSSRGIFRGLWMNSSGASASSAHESAGYKRRLIKLQALQDGVKDPEIGRGVGAGPRRHCQPPLLAAGSPSIQVLHKVPLAQRQSTSRSLVRKEATIMRAHYASSRSAVAGAWLHPPRDSQWSLARRRNPRVVNPADVSQRRRKAVRRRKESDRESRYKTRARSAR